MKQMDQIRCVRQYRERLLNDPYRPGYHFAIPDDDGRPGDPNGMFYADGRYHLMYLYRRDGGGFHWGHVSSTDLVHWRHHPDCLAEGDNDHGCFSGGGFVDDDGAAYLSFWIFNADASTQGRNAGIGIARSVPPYDVWTRLPGAVISSTEWGIKDVEQLSGSIVHLACADPSNIWKENDVYYMQAGNLPVLNQYGRGKDSPMALRGDWTDLFSSKDLKQWNYEGRFYQRRQDNSWTAEGEDDMCPSYLPLPASMEGGRPSGKMLQLFISHNRGCQYYIGRQQGNRFIPEKHGRMTWNDNSYFAPEACMDARGRQIMYAWMLDNLENDFDTFGWSGVFSLPRVLWLREDGELGIAPAPEVYRLAYNEQIFDDVILDDGSLRLDARNGMSCLVRMSIDLTGANQAGLRMRETLDGAAFAEVYYDAQAGELVLDSTHSGTIGRCIRESAPLILAAGEKLEIEAFIDRSVIEIFANRRQAIARRIFNMDPESVGISLFARGRAGFEAVTICEMMPSNPY